MVYYKRGFFVKKLSRNQEPGNCDMMYWDSKKGNIEDGLPLSLLHTFLGILYSKTNNRNFIIET